MMTQTHTRIPGRALMLAVVVALLALTACTNTTKPDDIQAKIKEQQKDELVEALGIKREAIDAFDAAVEAMNQKVPDLGRAQELLEKALSISPDFMEAQFNLGVVHEANARYDKALEAYGKAQQLDRLNTHSVAIILATGRTQSLKGDTEEAIKSFEEALRLAPEDINVLNALGAACFKATKYDQAMDYIQKVLREDNENLTALNTLAQVYTAQDNRSMAVYVFKKAARVAIGAITTDEELNTEPALLVLTDKVKNENLDRDLSADLFNNLGMIYLKMGETPLAVFNFNAAAKLSATHVESRLNVGAIYLRYLNYEGAKVQFNEALAAAPQNCTAKLGLAASHFAMSKNEEAITAYSGYLSSCNENDPSAHLQMEKLYEKTQDFDNAIKHCLKYVELATPKQGDPVTAEYCKALEGMKNMARDQPAGPTEGGEDGEGGEGGEGGEMPEGGEEMPEEGGEMPEEGAPVEEGAPAEEGAPVEEGAPAEGGEETPEGDAQP